MDNWEMPDDKIWALRMAARPQGFMPHARGTVDFLQSLESEGLLRQSDVAPIWHVTDKGRSELAELVSAHGD